MKHYLFFIIILFAFPLWAEECLLLEQMGSLQTKSLPQILKKSLCESVEKISDKDQLDQIIRTHFSNQTLELAQVPNDRHEMAHQLNDCSPETDSRALVINFAGTGAFNPRGFHVMKDILECYGESKIDESLRKRMFYSIAIQQRKEWPETYKWSGIEAGPLNQFFTDPFLKSQAHKLDFAVFASEEAEVFSNPQDLSLKDLSVHHQNPVGVSMAQKCVESYLERAKALSIDPKIIVITHSSGGRSAVKLAEKLKAQNIKLDLVYSMDPVKEAQKAMLEVAGKKITFRKNAVVESKLQPKRLYKPENAQRWVNVYQKIDTAGLKGKIKFGIHGSPVVNADKNLLISNGLGASAHGEITYSPESNQLFIQEMKALLD